MVFLPGKDLGQGHSQNNQSFGLGGHLFWECPCPRALPHTQRHGNNPFLGSLPCYLYFYECKSDLHKRFCWFFFRQECLKARHASMQQLAKGTPPPHPHHTRYTSWRFLLRQRASIHFHWLLLCWKMHVLTNWNNSFLLPFLFVSPFGPKHQVTNYDPNPNYIG